MTTSQRTSSSHRPPEVVHHHVHSLDSRLLSIYKPPEKPLPPGAHLYDGVWLTIKTLIQLGIFNSDPFSYTGGFLVGAGMALYKWSEYGPPSKLAIDAETIDFGGMAHSSSYTAQLAVIAENVIAAAIPIFSHVWLPTTESANQAENYESITSDPLEQSFIRGELYKSPLEYLPKTPAQIIRAGFITYKAVLFGEEVVQRFARWIDTSLSSKK